MWNKKKVNGRLKLTSHGGQLSRYLRMSLEQLCRAVGSLLVSSGSCDISAAPYTMVGLGSCEVALAGVAAQCLESDGTTYDNKVKKPGFRISL